MALLHSSFDTLSGLFLSATEPALPMAGEVGNAGGVIEAPWEHCNWVSLDNLASGWCINLAIFLWIWSC